MKRKRKINKFEYWVKTESHSFRADDGAELDAKVSACMAKGLKMEDFKISVEPNQRLAQQLSLKRARAKSV